MTKVSYEERSRWWYETVFILSENGASFDREVPTGMATLHDLACYSTNKADTTSSLEGMAQWFVQEVAFRVIGDKSLVLWLYSRPTVLLSEKALCVSGVVVTMRL